jgi:hypothetical protein
MPFYVRDPDKRRDKMRHIPSFTQSFMQIYLKDDAIKLISLRLQNLPKPKEIPQQSSLKFVQLPITPIVPILENDKTDNLARRGQKR